MLATDLCGATACGLLIFIMTTHKLIGRYGHSATLTQVEHNKWEFDAVEKDNCRYGSDASGIMFVDPSGGPFIGKGSTFRNFTVLSIVVESGITYLITDHDP